MYETGAYINDHMCPGKRHVRHNWIRRSPDMLRVRAGNVLAATWTCGYLDLAATWTRSYSPRGYLDLPEPGRVESRHFHAHSRQVR